MNNSKTNNQLIEKFGISPKVMELIDKSEEAVSGLFSQLDDIMAYNQYKVLDAFQNNTIRDMHFAWNTGYGYDDAGRDATERVFADIFHTDDLIGDLRKMCPQGFLDRLGNSNNGIACRKRRQIYQGIFL